MTERDDPELAPLWAAYAALKVTPPLDPTLPTPATETPTCPDTSSPSS